MSFIVVHLLIPYETLHFFPLSPTLTIRAYHFRNATSEVWSYSAANYNADQWIDFYETNFPHSDLKQWIASDFEAHMSILFDFVHTKLFEHHHVRMLKQSISNLFPNGVCSIDSVMIEPSINIL
eukprot:274542_1